MSHPVRPVDAYKAIIDELVNETSIGVGERLVVTESRFPQFPDDEACNAFVNSLSLEQRKNLAKLLHSERTSAIHDVLAVFSWWLQTRGLGFTYHGEPMPTELSDMGLHGDYIGRQQGWEWPTDES
jgi:hypothetical protein